MNNYSDSESDHITRTQDQIRRDAGYGGAESSDFVSDDGDDDDHRPHHHHDHIRYAVDHPNFSPPSNFPMPHHTNTCANHNILQNCEKCGYLMNDVPTHNAKHALFSLPTTIFRCTICQLGFITSKGWRRHMEGLHEGYLMPKGFNPGFPIEEIQLEEEDDHHHTHNHHHNYNNNINKNYLTHHRLNSVPSPNNYFSTLPSTSPDGEFSRNNGLFRQQQQQSQSQSSKVRPPTKSSDQYCDRCNLQYSVSGNKKAHLALHDNWDRLYIEFPKSTRCNTCQLAWHTTSPGLQNHFRSKICLEGKLMMMKETQQLQFAQKSGEPLQFAQGGEGNGFDDDDQSDHIITVPSPHRPTPRLFSSSSKLLSKNRNGL